MGGPDLAPQPPQRPKRSERLGFAGAFFDVR